LKLTLSIKKVKLLHIYFSNEEGIRKLACLKPIAELTNKRRGKKHHNGRRAQRLVDSF